MQTKIVIPDDIYEKIKVEAEKNFRTINQEINYRLHKSFTAPAYQPAYPYPYQIRGGDTHDVTN